MLKSFLQNLFILSAVVGIFACSRPPQELKTAESLIETAPDSALHILQHLSPDKYKSGESRALYGLLMIQTLDRKLLPLKPKSLLDYSISYYEQNPEPDRLACCYFFKGRTYKYALQYEKATIFYLKALDEAKGSKNYLLLGRINFDMGDIYNIQKDFGAARKKFYLAYTLLRKNNYQPQTFYSLLYIGRTYHESKEYKKAESFYKQILPHAKDSLLKAALYQEIGLNFYDSKIPDSALYYYKKIISYPYIGNNRAIRYHLLANVYYDLKNTDSAFYYAKNAFRYEPTIRTQRECYRIMTNCEFIRGNVQNVTSYMNKYVRLGDSLNIIDAQTKGSYIESKHNTELKYVKTRNGLWYSLGFIILIVVLSYILYTQLYKKSKKEKEQIHEKHLLQKTNMHKEVLVNHREVLQNKIKERKSMLAPERKKADQTGKIAIDRKVYEELLHIHDTEYFYDEMNSELNNLVNKLNKLYPTLSPREIMWCCLSLLQVSSTDMYMLLDTNVDSLKKMKQRLAPKFNLALVSELENFLIKLISE